MRPSAPSPRLSRRGLTLLEMLVAVALLVLMMTIITSIFQAATGAIIAAKTYQELDANLRQLDTVLRQDLTGATADTGSGPLIPPFDPDLNLGYFEIGENQFADLQGEDSDDYLRFTAQAPEGQFFTGRMWVGPVTYLVNGTTTVVNQPVMIQSRYAEIIYFLRNGNLYRRVFLVAPERQAAVNAVYTAINANGNSLTTAIAGNPSLAWQFPIAALPGLSASWLGMNDLSARPTSNPTANLAPTLNTLGDLTNRENRMFAPRFSNDYLTYMGVGNPPNPGPDGLWDDVNATSGLPGTMLGDGVPDWWPTLYPGVFNPNNINGALLNITQIFPRQPDPTSNTDLLAFPYIYPGAFSLNDTNAQGKLHALDNTDSTTGLPIIQGTAAAAYPLQAPYGNVYAAGQGAIPAYSLSAQSVVVPRPNHNPIADGDTLTLPGPQGTIQTWWGFPTWKETMSPNWNDPVRWLSGAGLLTAGQPTGLSWSSLASNPPNGWLPPMNIPGVDVQDYNDGVGLPTFTMAGSLNPYNYTVENKVFRDDMIMQGVRSFDVKVYDNAIPGYADLGYSSYVGGAILNNQPNVQLAAALLATMGHEGRIPPLNADFRSDPNYPNWLPNIGDDNPLINGRLRRVYDTWSTDYSNAPAVGLDLSSPTLTGNLVAGPPLSAPVYPSYPPPYPAPLSGIQVQIRVVDPRNASIKVLTIRHSFAN